MLDKALNLLAIAQKGGNIAIGEDPVGAAAHGGKARLIILASDAAVHTRRRASDFGALHHTPVVTIDADKSMLGGMFGRSSVAMAALTEIRLAKSFLETLEEPERYSEALSQVSEKEAAIARRKKTKPRRNRERGTR